MKKQQSSIKFDTKEHWEVSRIRQFTQLICELPAGSFSIFINAKDSIHSIMDVKQVLEDNSLIAIGEIGQNLEITEDELKHIEGHLPKSCCAFSFKKYDNLILLEVKIEK